MNYDTAKDATDRPVNFNNEATPDAAILSDSPVSTTAATITSDIALDAHFLSSGINLNTELFSKGNLKRMADNDIIETTPDPDAPDANTPDTSVQDAGSTESNYPNSLRNRKKFPYSANNMKNRKRRKKEN